MFKKILVALDTHDAYAHVFDQALDLATATGAALKLLGVLTTGRDYTVPAWYYPIATDYTMTMDGGFWQTYEEECRKDKAKCMERLSALKQRAEAAGVQVDLLQASGEPGPVICDRAKTEEIDLIIVGTHGRRGLDELLVGSVSSYVMHRAPCSVMVVHPQMSKLSQSAEPLAEPLAEGLSTKDIAEISVS